MDISSILLAVLAGCGAAIVLVEKKNDWPATAVRPLLTWVLEKIHKKLSGMLNCTVCTAFWATLFAELWIVLYTRGSHFPMWPLSGFVSISVAWGFIQLLNAIDPPKPDTLESH